MTKRGIYKKATVAIVALVVGCFSLASIMKAFATASVMLSFSASGEVELDGTSGSQVTVSLTAGQAGKLYVAQGAFSTTETDDANNYFTVSSFNPSSTISGYSQDSSLSTGQFYYVYSTAADGVDFNAGDHLYEMVYNVSADTPAGTYHLPINIEYVQRVSIDDYEEEVVVEAVVTVTRNEQSETKPNQVVTFRDGEGNVIGSEGITKYYGDDEFTVTKEVTTGDGEISQYHPDDDGSGSIAHTVPDGDLVGVGEPGDVDICAWVDGTENYEATTACYTVHVLKRPLDIIGATIAPKTYDGTYDANVTSVSFEDRNLNNDEYRVTNASFESADAGENVVVHISVELTGGAENNYVLNASNFDTTATIAPYHLIRDNVTLVGSGTYGYEIDGVEPGVIVEANTHGGTSTLVEGQDYEVVYSNNTNVTNEAHVTVTGINNYTTGEVPVVIDFTIEAKGINNGNLIAPSSIVEGHILTPNEIRINVDGHDLVQCASAEDTNCDYFVEIQGENDGVIGHNIHVAVNARGNYAGVATADIEVVAKQPQTVSFGDTTEVTASFGDGDFKHEATTDGDGAIAYSSSNEAVATVNPGSGMVTIVGVGEADIIATAAETDEYAEGSAKYTLRVSKAVVTVTSASVNNRTYDGTTAATVSNVSLSATNLVFNTDFTASATFDKADAGDRIATINVTLSSDAFANYCFMINSSDCEDTAAYITDGNIAPFTLGADNATEALSNTAYGYDGEAKEPTASVSVDLDGDGTKETALIAGTDYTMSYEDNVNAGVARATITGTGNYTNSLPALEFTISPATVSDVVVTASSQTYTGAALTPTLTVTGTVNGESVTFTADDYTVAAHEDFVNAGDYTVTVNSKDGSNYNIPTASGTFTIDKAGSGEPAEFSEDLKIEAGKTLAELGEMTEGFNWVDSSEVVAAGEGHYNATYTKNNDTANYETSNLSISVYGLKRINVTTVQMSGGSVTGPGATALEGDELVFTVTPDEGYELSLVTVNGNDKTSDASSNRLTMTAGTEDIMAIFYFRRVYEVVKGAGQTHIINEDGSAEFEIDADFELFEEGGEVYVDDELVDPENYEATSGSTVIKFTADYMNSLAVGEHRLAVVFNDGGVARTTFVIAEKEEEKPAAADTGVFTGETGGVMATGISIIAVFTLAGVLFAKSKKHKQA